jgi:hypothetical protein
MEPKELLLRFVSPAGDDASYRAKLSGWRAGESLETSVDGGAIFRWIAKCGTVSRAEEGP